MTWYGVATLKRQDNKKNKRYTLYIYSSSRLLMSRGSIVLALWIRVQIFLKNTKLSGVKELSRDVLKSA